LVHWGLKKVKEKIGSSVMGEIRAHSRGHGKGGALQATKKCPTVDSRPGAPRGWC
jgi:hypothetical protein